MVKIMNKNVCKVGDEVWYIDSWGYLRNGVIYEIKEEKRGKLPPIVVALTKEHGSNAGAKLEDCWPSKEACLKAEEQRVQAQVAEYKESIKSVEDLARFLYNNNINDSECPDWEARKAAEERASELGINLKES